MKIHLLKNEHITYYNLERWNISEYPVLLVIGLSGSGKTTFANKFAKQTGSTLVSFDVLKYYNEASCESQKILDIFLETYPEIKRLINIQWKKTDASYTNDKLYSLYCVIFFDFILNYSKREHKTIVLEGIQIFVRVPPEKTIGMPMIIVGSSSFKSCKNKYKRDYLKEKKDFYLVSFISQVYTYHIKHRFVINKYVCYYKRNIQIFKLSFIINMRKEHFD